MTNDYFNMYVPLRCFIKINDILMIPLFWNMYICNESLIFCQIKLCFEYLLIFILISLYNVTRHIKHDRKLYIIFFFYCFSQVEKNATLVKLSPWSVKCIKYLKILISNILDFFFNSWMWGKAGTTLNLVDIK